MVLTGDPREAFTDADWCILVGSKPRGPGMERADLLKDNGRIFVEQGKAIDEVASDEARVVVVGNPCNTNCMIAAAQATRLGPERFTAMTRLDQNRAQTQLAQKAGVAVTEVDDIIIFGNHSPTMFADFTNATHRRQAGARGDRRRRLARERVPADGRQARRGDHRGPRPVVGGLGGQRRDRPRALAPHPGRRRSTRSPSARTARYGFDEGVWASVPVRTTAPGTYEVVREGWEHDDFAKSKIAATNAELAEERETVKEMLG